MRPNALLCNIECICTKTCHQFKLQIHHFVSTLRTLECCIEFCANEIQNCISCMRSGWTQSNPFSFLSKNFTKISNRIRWMANDRKTEHCAMRGPRRTTVDRYTLNSFIHKIAKVTSRIYFISQQHRDCLKLEHAHLRKQYYSSISLSFFICLLAHFLEW